MRIVRCAEERTVRIGFTSSTAADASLAATLKGKAGVVELFAPTKNRPVWVGLGSAFGFYYDTVKLDIYDGIRRIQTGHIH